MATIHNEITIDAPVEKVWSIIADPAQLEKYDPTVKSSVVISGATIGEGAKRKVTMLDGKNWFDEMITVYKPGHELTYQLTACSFPMQGLQHSYSFEPVGNQTRIKQTMVYTVKFGIIGRLLDMLMIRKQSDTGIKKFFAGLKTYAENNRK